MWAVWCGVWCVVWFLCFILYWSILQKIFFILIFYLFFCLDNKQCIITTTTTTTTTTYKDRKRTYRATDGQDKGEFVYSTVLGVGNPQKEKRKKKKKSMMIQFNSIHILFVCFGIRLFVAVRMYSVQCNM
jgi:hypothetical protein